MKYNLEMNEFDALRIIHENLDVTEFLGNDCAEIINHDRTRSLLVTHDTLVEDVHFSLKTISPRQLGYKSVAVNVSDLCASLALPKYLSVSLSMPKDVNAEFLTELYRGINEACREFNCFVVGGDLTRSEKIIVSVCAIGQRECNVFAGRDRAETGDLVLLFGNAGASALGLIELSNDANACSEFTEAHLCPKVKVSEVAKIASTNPKTAGTMDTSDGLADAIYKIAQASCKELEIYGDKIPVSDLFCKTCSRFGLDVIETQLFGAEDFALVVTLQPEYVSLLSNDTFTVIGKVGATSKHPVAKITYDDTVIELTEELIKEKTFKHFSD